MNNIKSVPTGSYIVDIEQLNRQLKLDEKRHFIQGVKDDAYRATGPKICIHKKKIKFYLKMAKLLLFSKAICWFTIVYSTLMFISCHVTARQELKNIEHQRRLFKNSNETTAIRTPLLHTLGICSKIKVEKMENSIKGFESFAIFLLISYFTTVTTRVWNMYCCTVAAMGRINDIVCLARGCFEACDQQVSNGRLFLIDIHRFCSLSWVACFVGVTEAYTVDNLFRPFCRAHAIPGVTHLDMGLLSKEEFIQVQTIIYLNKGGNGLRFFIKCALRTAAMAEKRGIISEQSYNVLINKIILLRAKIGTLFDYRMMPINAGYKLLVNFSTYSYLVVFVTIKVLVVFQSGSGATIVVAGFITIYFLMFIIVGLLTLAHELEFPFSKDGLFDHRVTNLVHGIAQSSAKILFQSPCISTEISDIEADVLSNTSIKAKAYDQVKPTKRLSVNRRHTSTLGYTNISKLDHNVLPTYSTASRINEEI